MERSAIPTLQRGPLITLHVNLLARAFGLGSSGLACLVKPAIVGGEPLGQFLELDGGDGRNTFLHVYVGPCFAGGNGAVLAATAVGAFTDGSDLSAGRAGSRGGRASVARGVSPGPESVGGAASVGGLQASVGSID